MNNELNGRSVGFLKYVVYVFLAILIFVTGSQAITLYSLPSDYVRTERYKIDNARLEQGLRDINLKLDRLIERGGP